jgi:choline dehydrogenase-like flavoprotein
MDPHAPLPIIDARSAPGGKIELQADVVIVGSGASGAVCAYELAARGRKVVVLEAGGYHQSKDFTETMADMFGRLFVDKGGQTNADGDFLVLQGQCIGGSTVVNGAVCFRIPEFILDEWVTKHGLTDLKKEHLWPIYERVEKRLSVHVNQPHEINENSRIMERGCTKLGWSHKPLSRNTKDCALTGFCVYGCATDRKQSMLVTYIPWALQKGAKVYADTRVEQIRTEGGRAVGVSGRMIDPQTGKTVAEVTVDAPLVILGAGAVQTPLLLLKNELCNRSDQVGRNFALHPSCVCVGLFDEEVYGYRGATLGSYCDEFEALDKGGFILEGGTAGADALQALSPGFGKAHVDFMLKYKHMASMASLVHDESVGRISWDGDRKKIEYRLSEHDVPKVRASMAASARILFAAGAKEVYLPTYAPNIIRRVEDIDTVLDGLDLGPSTVFYYSYHPQGTCRMGTDPATSVVSPTGETHDVKGLYIADASIFPSSILVNPQMTVYALATHIAEGILARG